MYFDVVDNWCTGKISRKDKVGIDAPQQAYTPRSGQECHHPWGGKFFRYIICSKNEYRVSEITYQNFPFL